MARQWYILQNNKKYGPYSEEQMRSFIGEGRLKRDTPVWCQGMKGWERAADLETFKSHFAPVGPPPFPERRGGGRRTAAVVSLVIATIVVGVGIWWIYPQLTRSTQPQSSQPQTGPAFGEAEGTLYTAQEEGVHDGDTIYVSMPLTRVNQDIQSEISDPQWIYYVGVRFARIDAPEVSPTMENGALEAKNFVKQLIVDGGNKVYLDLDNLAVSDYGERFRDTSGNRLVAVVYVYIDNKLVNVNAEVLRLGETNYPNHSWIPYYVNPYPSEFENDIEKWRADNYPYVR